MCVSHFGGRPDCLCVCVLVTAQTIKRIMSVLHQRTLHLPICDDVHFSVSDCEKMTTEDTGLKDAFIRGNVCLLWYFFMLFGILNKFAIIGPQNS